MGRSGFKGWVWVMGDELASSVAGSTGLAGFTGVRVGAGPGEWPRERAWGSTRDELQPVHAKHVQPRSAGGNGAQGVRGFGVGGLG